MHARVLVDLNNLSMLMLTMPDAFLARSNTNMVTLESSAALQKSGQDRVVPAFTVGLIALTRRKRGPFSNWMTMLQLGTLSLTHQPRLKASQPPQALARNMTCSTRNSGPVCGESEALAAFRGGRPLADLTKRHNNMTTEPIASTLYAMGAP